VVRGVFFLLIWAEKCFRLGYGRLFALYVAAYTLGRVWVEALRVDHANRVLGLRLNVWTSIVIFIAAVAFLVLARRGQPAAATTARAAQAEPADGDGRPGAADGEIPAMITNGGWQGDSQR
jgi:prolipoprotein diacylglyceryltransferase